MRHQKCNVRFRNGGFWHLFNLHSFWRFEQTNWVTRTGMDSDKSSLLGLLFIITFPYLDVYRTILDELRIKLHLVQIISSPVASYVDSSFHVFNSVLKAMGQKLSLIFFLFFLLLLCFMLRRFVRDHRWGVSSLNHFVLGGGGDCFGGFERQRADLPSSFGWQWKPSFLQKIYHEHHGELGTQEKYWDS